MIGIKMRLSGTFQAANAITKVEKDTVNIPKIREEKLKPIDFKNK